jgi:hypothetical protein
MIKIENINPRAQKRGRPRIEEMADTIEAAKPWIALGMSRRTWYRRQREKADKEKNGK